MNKTKIQKSILTIASVAVIGAVVAVSGYALAAQSPQTAFADSTSHTFTMAELQSYNGQNGAAAYIAVDGVVYDVSNIFTNGRHHGAVAGTDQTAAFYSEHSKSQLNEAIIVGKLSANTATAQAASANHSTLTAAQQTQANALLAEAQRLELFDDELDLQEDALERAYHAGTLTVDAYRAQLAALEQQERTQEVREDEIERQLHSLGLAEPDYDDDNDDDDDDDDYDCDDAYNKADDND